MRASSTAVSVVLWTFQLTAAMPAAFADKGDGIIDPGEDEIAELARSENRYNEN